jgi:hypothetical protein
MSAEQTLPTPPELAQAPELALIALLHHALELTVRVLIAAHPQLNDLEKPYWIPQPHSTTIAQTILSTVYSLQQNLDDYRHQIHTEINPTTTDKDPYPF